MDIMLDLETLSLDARATVISFGAVAFDPAGSDHGCVDSYYTVLNSREQTDDYHRTVSSDVLDWWEIQKEEVRLVIPQSCRHKIKLKEDLDDFTEWCSRRNNMASWQVCDQWKYDNVSKKHRGGFFA